MKRYFAIIFAVALLLSGCAAAPGTTGMQLATWPTVEDIFTSPTTTVPTGPSIPGATQPTSPVEPPVPGGTGDMGGMSFGIRGDREMDEMGHFYRYEGEELCLPFALGASGQAKFDTAKQGIGILLFLDGQPQPYRVGADGELTYFHVFYPDFNLMKPSNEEVIYDLYITPVAGENGDMMELYATTISYPHWQTSDPQTGWKYTFGGNQYGTRVKMEATPRAEKPNITERISNVDISYANVPYSLIEDWSDRDLIERYAYTWSVDGRRPKLGNGYIYDFQASDSVELRFEIWGTPYVRYGLMFYIDNQPISAQQEILFDMQSGKKTIVTFTLDLSDFDGECVVYAALIPRNAKTPENFDTYAFLDMSKAYFLLDDPEPEK